MTRSKYIGSVLILMLFVPFVATYFLLTMKKAELKREIKHKLLSELPADELTEFHFTDLEINQLEWEGDDEFEIEKQMYDVVSSKKEGNGTTYYCWKDDKESDLKKKMRSLLNAFMGGNRDRQQKSENLIHFLQSLYASPLFQWQPLTPERSNLNHAYLCISKTHFTPPPSPPPWA